MDVENLFEAGDGGDGVHVEVRPGAKLADVPPVMLPRVVTRSPRTRDEPDFGVRGGEVGHQLAGRLIPRFEDEVLR